MRLTWLTQGGYLVEAGGQRLAIDPYLSEAAATFGCTRMRPAPLSAEALAPDWLICTHSHVDHWDPIGAPEVLRRHPRCRLLAPRSVRPLALAAGVAAERILPFDVGDTPQAGAFRPLALPAVHSDHDAVGVLLQAEGLTTYHSADTEYTTALAKDLEKRISAVTPRLDAALVCINGRLGNQTWQEAALVCERLRPRLAVPNHYDLFAENLADPEPFLARCRQLGLTANAWASGIPVELESAQTS